MGYETEGGFIVMSKDTLVNRRKGTKWDIKQIKEIVSRNGNGCVLVSNEYDWNIKMDFICACGKPFKTTWNHFINNNKKQCNICPTSKGKRIDWDMDRVEKFITEQGNGCQLITKTYINATTNMEFICKCGEHFNTTWNKFVSRGKRHCSKCGYKIRSGKTTKTQQEFLKEVSDLVDDEYTVLGKYVNSGENIKIKHNECGYEFEVIAHNFLRCPSCPKCTEITSKGSRRVREYLEDNKIKYIEEYTFKDCIYKSKLRFDFVLFNNDNKIIHAIEYDGEQHFKPINFGGMSDEDAEIEYLKTKKRDSIKNEYCINNNIPLTRIAYTEYDNIELILDNANHAVIHGGCK